MRGAEQTLPAPSEVKPKPCEDRSQDLLFADRLEAILPELRAFSRSLCYDRDLADDLVQATCLAAWRAAGSFDHKASIKSWTFKILKNEYFQYLRKNKRLEFHEPEKIEETLETYVDEDDRSDDVSSVVKLLDRLPDQQKVAMVLVHAAGYTYEEAGEILNCSPGTVKSRVSRARQAILVDLDNDGGVAMSEMGDAQSLQGLLEETLRATAPERLPSKSS